MLKVLQNSAHKRFADVPDSRIWRPTSVVLSPSILTYNKTEYRAESNNLNLFYTDPRILYRLQDCNKYYIFTNP